jgi:hypothetical protein
MPQTKPIKKTALAVSPTEAAVPAATAKEKELTEFQKFITDLFADMMLRGGNHVLCQELTGALAGHHYNQLHYERDGMDSDSSYNSDQEDSAITRYQKNEGLEWFGRLRMNWPVRGKAFVLPESNAIGERVRSRARGNLRELCEAFCVGATPEEVLILTSIFEYWEGHHGSVRHEIEDATLPLADGFAESLAKSERYIRVPYRHWDLVSKYLDLLQGKDNSKAA